MALGVPSVGEAGKKADLEPWSGTPPRDEFYWLSEINKATFVTNTAAGLLDRKSVRAWCEAQERVIAMGNTPGNPRPKMYVRYEPLLIKEAGIEVTLIHAGRSSQDMHATFQRAMIRDQIVRIIRNLNAARSALLTLADQNRDTIAPCYTNGVAAQPNSLGHTWLGHLEGFRRDIENLKEFWARLNLSPMGTTVLNGTPWPLDRHGMAKLLGFEGIIDNAYDAGQIAGTDVAIEVELKLVEPLLHVTQFIQDVMTQYAQPRPWILVSATYASTAMPQKRNPGALIVRRDANEVLGEISGVIFRAHDLAPGMYDAKDQRSNATLLSDAASVFDAFGKVIGLLKVNPDRALEELNLDWTASQNIADVMMQKFGIPFREGHHYSSELVTFARAHEYTPLTLPYSDAKSLYETMVKKEGLTHIPSEFPFSESAFRSLLDPKSIVEARRSEGGPQKPELDRLFKAAEQSLSDDTAWLESKVKLLQDAETELDSAFRSLEGE